MNKNVGNLNLEIGNLFFGKNINNVGSSVNKTDGISEFYSCLSKVSDREDRAAVQNDQKYDNSSRVENTSDDFENDKNAPIKNQTNKIDSEDKNVSVDKLEQTQNADTTEEVKDTAEVVEDALTMVASVMANPNMQADVNINAEAVDGEAVTVEAIDTESVAINTVGENSVSDMNSGLADGNYLENDNGFGEVLVKTTAVTVNSEMSVAQQPVSDNIEVDGNVQMNVTETAIVNVSADNVNVTDTSSTNANLNVDSQTSGNVVELDNAIADDIVYVNINEENSVQREMPIQNMTGESPEVQSTVLGEKGMEIKTDMDVNSENIGEVEVNFEEQVNTVAETDNTTQSETESDDLNSEEFGEGLEASIEAETEFEPSVTVNDRVDVRTVNLQNIATRHANVAQAVQTTIIQNTADMMGRMESKSMELMLNPENLGKVVIRMQSTAEGLNIKIIADNSDINKGLEMRIFQIENTIKAQGVNLNNIEIEHSSVSDNGASGFTGFENSAKDFEGFAQQNQNSNRSAHEEYIEYTEYSYEGVDGADISSATDGIWRTGSSNVEFLA